MLSDEIWVSGLPRNSVSMTGQRSLTAHISQSTHDLAMFIVSDQSPHDKEHLYNIKQHRTKTEKDLWRLTLGCQSTFF